mgnify:CR=1 FL=1
MGLEHAAWWPRARSHKTCAGPECPAMSGRAGERTVFWGGEDRQGRRVWWATAKLNALILMGDWCAAAQPNIENQARSEFDDGGCSLEGAILMDKRVRSCGAGGVCLPLDGGG